MADNPRDIDLLLHQINTTSLRETHPAVLDDLRCLIHKVLSQLDYDNTRVVFRRRYNPIFDPACESTDRTYIRLLDDMVKICAACIKLKFPDASARAFSVTKSILGSDFSRYKQDEYLFYKNLERFTKIQPASFYEICPQPDFYPLEIPIDVLDRFGIRNKDIVAEYLLECEGRPKMDDPISQPYWQSLLRLLEILGKAKDDNDKQPIGLFQSYAGSESDRPNNGEMPYH